MINQYMSWEGGVDLVACTSQGMSLPNVIIHVARLVHTPVGSAPSGMVLLQVDSDPGRHLYAFLGHSPAVNAYFGPKIFADTPFEQAPALEANIDVWSDYPRAVGSVVKVAGQTIETRLLNLGELKLINRPASMMPPFAQQGLEAAAEKAELVVNGKNIPLIVPPIGISGGPAAVWAPAGIYAR